MAIRSDTFGGVELTGKDAAKFQQQVKDGRVNAAAKETLARGKDLLARFKEKARAESAPLED